MLLLFWRTTGAPPVVVTTPETMYGGGQEAIEQWKADRRNRERAIEARKQELADLKERLFKAEQEKQRKAKAKAQSKAKQAIEARILRFTREIEENEAQLAALLLELSFLQARINHLAILDQRRRLLLVALTM